MGIKCYPITQTSLSIRPSVTEMYLLNHDILKFSQISGKTPSYGVTDWQATKTQPYSFEKVFFVNVIRCMLIFHVTLINAEINV